MASVTPMPFAIGILLGIGLFAALTWFLIRYESTHPVQFRTRPIDIEPHLSHTRLAAICVVFALWSLWATARPVSGWR
jgi:hypothetical protein